MLVSVLPLARSLHPRPYTYSVSEVWGEQVRIGCLVEIPIGKHIERGIVAEIWNEEEGGGFEGEIRPIVSVISMTSLLSLTEITMTVRLSEYYLLPVHKVLGFFLPAPLLSRLDKRNYVFDLADISDKTLEKPQHQIDQYLDTIFSPKELSRYIEEGTVFCFPDDFFLLSFFEKKGEKDIGVILSESTATRKSQIWIDAYEKKYRILVGTRKILYYNLSRYKKLVYIEDAFGMEQYQYPYRIRNLDILRRLSDVSHLDITIISSSPSLFLFANFREFALHSVKNH